MEVFKLNSVDKNDKRVKYLIGKDSVLAEYINKKNKIEYYLSDNFNQLFVYTIIGQLISTKVANKIYAKFNKMCENNFSPEIILKFSANDLRSLGMTYKKANYILSFMQMLVNDKYFFDKISKMDDDKAMKELMKLHGIGKWTAKMLMMFYFDRQDLIPVEDLAFVKGYNHLYKCNKTTSQILKDCKRWSPYSSIASRYIYAYADEVFANVPKL